MRSQGLSQGRRIAPLDGRAVSHLPRQGEDLKSRLDGVGLGFSKVPPDAKIDIIPYLKTLKAAKGRVAADTTVSFTDWQTSYPGFRWLQHAGWTELSLAFSGTVRLPSEDEDRGITGTSFHAKKVNLVRVVPSVAATGSTVDLLIRAGDLGPEGSTAHVWFYKGGVDMTAWLNPSPAVIVHDDELNTDIVQAIQVTIEIPDDEALLGLWDIEIMTPWVHAGLPGLPGPSGPLFLQPHVGPHGGVMLPEVLRVTLIDLAEVRFTGAEPQLTGINLNHYDGGRDPITAPEWRDQDGDGLPDEEWKNIGAWVTQSAANPQPIKVRAVFRTPRTDVKTAWIWADASDGWGHLLSHLSEPVKVDFTYGIGTAVFEMDAPWDVVLYKEKYDWHWTWKVVEVDGKAVGWDFAESSHDICITHAPPQESPVFDRALTNACSDEYAGGQTTPSGVAAGIRGGVHNDFIGRYHPRGAIVQGADVLGEYGRTRALGCCTYANLTAHLCRSLGLPASTHQVWGGTSTMRYQFFWVPDWMMGSIVLEDAQGNLRRYGWHAVAQAGGDYQDAVLNVSDVIVRYWHPLGTVQYPDRGDYVTFAGVPTDGGVWNDITTIFP